MKKYKVTFSMWDVIEKKDDWLIASFDLERSETGSESEMSANAVGSNTRNRRGVRRKEIPGGPKDEKMKGSVESLPSFDVLEYYCYAFRTAKLLKVFQNWKKFLNLVLAK